MIRSDAKGLAALGRLLMAFGLVILIAAYAAIAIHASAPLLWSVPVHEDGVRTFGDTVLYYEHATRELPLDLILGLVVGAGAAYALPRSTVMRRALAEGRFHLLAAMTALTAFGIILGASAEGWRTVSDNLLQNHTRPGAPLEFGSHWRYHVLERLGMIVISIGLAGALRALVGPRNASDGTLAGSMLFACLVLFAGLTGVFFGSPTAFAMAFHDPQYLGHQAREVMTHSIVTLPLAWGACLLLAAQVANPNRMELRAGPLIGAGAWLAAGIGLCLYAVLAALRADSVSHGQSEDLATLIFPHYFEHSFTYLITPLLAGATFLGLMLSRPKTP